jgi:hypothetical protein
MRKNSTEELRQIIARCCEESEAAGKVALRAMRAVEREGRRRADQMRELRSRLTTLEAQLGKARTR